MRLRSGKRFAAATAGALLLMLGAGVGLAGAEAGGVAGDHRQDGDTPAAEAPGQAAKADDAPEETPSAAAIESATAAAASSSSEQVCDGDPSGKSDDGNGANTGGADDEYQHNCGAPSANGNGVGNATGRPDAGAVGNADDKNPPGQATNGGDANSGYECDAKGDPNGGNRGVGVGNPAHTTCKPATPSTPVNPPVSPPADPPAVGGAVTPSVEVLGVVFNRPATAAVAPAALARTGGTILVPIRLGMTLLLVGLGLVVASVHWRKPATAA